MKKPELNFDTPSNIESAMTGQGGATASNLALAPADAMDSGEVLRLSRLAVRTTQRARQREGQEFYSGQMSTALHERIRKCVYEKRVTKAEIISQALEHYLTKIGY
ncbi:MAG: hypothetical protein WCC66_02860 [Rhizobiaceae bacterium]